MSESIASTPLPTELASLVSTISEAGQDYSPAVAALAKLGIDSRKHTVARPTSS
jgi:hypothetical protein